jgi:hypothetical protein
MSGLSNLTKESGQYLPKLRIRGKQRTTGGLVSSFSTVSLDRIKLHRDVFGVYSKVYILYYSQNGRIERLHLKNAIFTQRNEWNNEKTLVEDPVW